MDGICTLANDRVYDQLVALLNSIEAIQGSEIPVCVYPYDDNVEQIAAEIARRPHVQLYDNRDSIQEWDNFARQIWDAHPTAQDYWQKIGCSKYHRIGTHRRYCAFDGPFDRFVYMDADTLLMSPLDKVFAQLEKNDWIVYDFQYKDLAHVYHTSPKLKKIFTSKQLQQAFCSGFYASKKDLFNHHQRELVLGQLLGGEVQILYNMAPDQTILNYIVMRLGISSYNFALQLPENERTGCCVTSTHFQEQNNILYDKGNPLIYIHYIGLPIELFTRICDGENIDFPYRELFLYYRYLYEPEQRPIFTTPPKVLEDNITPSLTTRILRKLGLAG